jgi:hypothetical protein
MVPWQMNNTFIGISYLQNCIKLLQFAPVCQVAEVSCILRRPSATDAITSGHSAAVTATCL